LRNVIDAVLHNKELLEVYFFANQILLLELSNQRVWTFEGPTATNDRYVDNEHVLNTMLRRALTTDEISVRL
jgi:hypothetical protein